MNESKSEKIVRVIGSLTMTDIIRWEYDKNNEYIATYRNNTLRLNCRVDDPIFDINGDKIRLGLDDAFFLCNEIAKQGSRLQSQRWDSDFDSLLK
jgi:hypothetical protein